MSSPQFSIIVPCYNQEKFLEDTLNSVLQQTFQDWECIVVNDGSTDQSEKIIDHFCEKDKRFQKINQQNSGLAQTRNNGIHAARGVFILPLDGDDKIGNQYLELAQAEFEKNPKAKLVYCKAELFGNKNEYWPLPEYEYETLIFINCIFCSAIFRKSDFLKTEGYDVNMIYGYEDWEFWMQLLRKDDLVVWINSVQFYYRQSENSMISFKDDKEKRKKMEDYVYNKHRHVYEEVMGELSMENFLKLNKERQELRLIKKSFAYKIGYKLERKLKKIFK